jgi:hypothetical protein
MGARPADAFRHSCQRGRREPVQLFLDFAQDLHEARAVAAVSIKNGIDGIGFGHDWASEMRAGNIEGKCFSATQHSAMVPRQLNLGQLIVRAKLMVRDRKAK